MNRATLSAVLRVTRCRRATISLRVCMTSSISCWCSGRILSLSHQWSSRMGWAWCRRWPMARTSRRWWRDGSWRILLAPTRKTREMKTRAGSRRWRKWCHRWPLIMWGDYEFNLKTRLKGILFQKIVNRHKQQSEKAKELIEKLRPENGKSFDIDEVRIFLGVEWGKVIW